MLQKTKSKQILKSKYLFLLPALFSILVYTACTDASAKGVGDNTSDSEIIKNIEILKNSIAKQGGLSEEEERALKVLTAVTTNDEDILKDSTYDDVLNDLNIPFGVIHKAPVYPGCENLSNDEAKACFAQKLSQFVSNEFDASIGKKHNLTGNQKVFVRFKIDNTGQVTNIKANTDIPALQAEAERVAAKLPRMTPGEQDGKKVSVLYTLPISFTVK